MQLPCSEELNIEYLGRLFDIPVSAISSFGLRQLLQRSPKENKRYPMRNS